MHASAHLDSRHRSPQLQEPLTTPMASESSLDAHCCLVLGSHVQEVLPSQHSPGTCLNIQGGLLHTQVLPPSNPALAAGLKMHCCCTLLGSAQLHCVALPTLLDDPGSLQCRTCWASTCCWVHSSNHLLTVPLLGNAVEAITQSEGWRYIHITS